MQEYGRTFGGAGSVGLRAAFSVAEGEIAGGGDNDGMNDVRPGECFARVRPGSAGTAAAGGAPDTDDGAQDDADKQDRPSGLRTGRHILAGFRYLDALHVLEANLGGLDFAVLKDVYGEVIVVDRTEAASQCGAVGEPDFDG